VLSTAVSFIIPFLAWVPAEDLGASGVLAAVVAGLVTGYQSPRYLSARDRLAERVNWETVAFLLESGIFLLMGLQLKTLVDEDSAARLSVGQAVWIGLAAAGLVVVLRMVFIAPLVATLHYDAARAASAQPVLEKLQDRASNLRPAGNRTELIARRIARKKGDADFFVSENFGWRGGIVLAWAGMRGVVTVAAAQSLPTSIPYRPQVVLIAFVVAATTLLTQGLTLPRVILALKVPGDEAAADRAEYGELTTELSAKAAAVLDNPLSRPDGRPYADAVLDRVRDDLQVQLTFADPLAPGTASSREQYRELMSQVLGAERAELLAARSVGSYTSRTLTRAQHALDLQEAAFQRFLDLADPS
jgi:monovalent cation/hydrogen antiporter